MDEKALTRFGVTFGVLRRLGYSEEIVLRCLESVDGLDLEEAYEWVCSLIAKVALTLNVPTQLFMNCADEDLQPHARKLALPESLSLFIIDREAVPMDSNASTPKPKPSPALPTPANSSRTNLRESSLTPSTPQQRSTRVAGERQIHPFTALRFNDKLFHIPRTPGWL